jgi:hypothetical protein
MFIVTWLFDKLGYMPKIDMEVGKVKIDAQTPDFKMWPFPVVEVTSLAEKPKKKVIVPKATTKTKKPAAKKSVVVAKTARTKKK